MLGAFAGELWNCIAVQHTHAGEIAIYPAHRSSCLPSTLQDSAAKRDESAQPVRVLL